jgi:hypothetical protein
LPEYRLNYRRAHSSGQRVGRRGRPVADARVHERDLQKSEDAISLSLEFSVPIRHGCSENWGIWAKLAHHAIGTWNATSLGGCDEPQACHPCNTSAHEPQASTVDASGRAEGGDPKGCTLRFLEAVTGHSVRKILCSPGAAPGRGFTCERFAPSSSFRDCLSPRFRVGSASVR